MFSQSYYSDQNETLSDAIKNAFEMKIDTDNSGNVVVYELPDGTYCISRYEGTTPGSKLLGSINFDRLYAEAKSGYEVYFDYPEELFTPGSPYKDEKLYE